MCEYQQKHACVFVFILIVLRCSFHPMLVSVTQPQPLTNLMLAATEKVSSRIQSTTAQYRTQASFTTLTERNR